MNNRTTLLDEEHAIRLKQAQLFNRREEEKDAESRRIATNRKRQETRLRNKQNLTRRLKQAQAIGSAADINSNESHSERDDDPTSSKSSDEEDENPPRRKQRRSGRSIVHNDEQQLEEGEQPDNTAGALPSNVLPQAAIGNATSNPTMTTPIGRRRRGLRSDDSDANDSEEDLERDSFLNMRRAAGQGSSWDSQPIYIQRVQATVSLPKPITGEHFSKHRHLLPKLLAEQEQANRAMLSENVELPLRETQFDDQARFSITQTLLAAATTATYDEDYPGSNYENWLHWPLEKFYQRLAVALRKGQTDKGKVTDGSQEGLPRLINYIKNTAQWENINMFDHLVNIDVFSMIAKEMSDTFGQEWLRDSDAWAIERPVLKKLTLQALAGEGWASAGSFPRTRGRHNLTLGTEVKRLYEERWLHATEPTWSLFAYHVLEIINDKHKHFSEVRNLLSIKYDETYRLIEQRNQLRYVDIPWSTLVPQEDKNKIKRVDQPKGKPTSGKPKGTDHGNASTSPAPTPPKERSEHGGPCNACGRPFHAFKVCEFRLCKPPHPDHNPDERTKWEYSDTGKQWALKGHSMLPASKTLNEANPTRYYAPERLKKSRQKSSKCIPTVSDDHSVSSCACVESMCNIIDNTTPAQRACVNNACLTGTLLHPTTLIPLLSVNVMLDTGSIPANFISRRVVDLAQPLGLGAIQHDPVQIKAAISGKTARSEGKIVDVVVALNGDVCTSKITSNKIFKTTMRCLDTDMDITFGLEAIAHNTALRDICLSLLKAVAYASNAGTCAGTRVQFQVTELGQLQESGAILPRDNTVAPAAHSVSDDEQSSLERLNYTESHGSNDTMNSEEEDLLPWEYPSDSTAEASFLPTIIEGDEAFKRSQVALCVKWKQVFSRELKPQPAKVPALELAVDTAAWDVTENRRPPRNQGAVRNHEIHLQVKKMLDMGVIRESNATAYSQVLLVRKPDHTWRFCIDYRRLNLRCKDGKWPLPNIIHMINRIGDTKARYFAVIDLTNGFFQAPLSEMSKAFTAFITPDGLYEWNRVAMGLSGSPSYFQRMMVTIVLRGLVHKLCEAYMDDIIVYGRIQAEYLKNLEAVLKRLADHGITVRPDKCRLGLETISYVGHTIDHEGKHFTPEKLRQVIDFPLPTTQGALRSFLGLANYFREHVKGHSLLAYPLHAMITHGKEYKKSAKLSWTTTTETAFKELQHAVNTCPKLFFMSDKDGNITGDIHLYTDASDIGYGAYLAQEHDGKPVPIQFLSHTFTTQQKKWGVNVREAYGLYASITKLRYLLRDIPFHLHTDHKNLTYIKDNVNSDMIYRWKVELMEYQFTLHHIKGTLNDVADYMSRNTEAELDAYESPDVVTNYFATLSEINTLVSEAERFDTQYICDSIPDDAYEKIEKVHNEVTGHHKVDNTLHKLDLSEQHWQYRRQHVTQFIKECDTCQKMSTEGHPIVTHPYTTGGHFPFETISMDSIGPFTDDTHGFKYIIAFICTMTRFLNMYAVKSADADEAAAALLNHTALYGMPCNLQSDGGPEYVNRVIEQFTTLVGAKRIITLAYAHQEQGIIERSNKEVGRWIREIIYDRKQVKSTWPQMIPFAIRIHNATPIRSIGYSPAQLVYGNSIDLNRNIFIPVEKRPKMNIVDFMAEKLEQQDEALQTAQALTREHEEMHITQNPVNQTEFAPGSMVLVAWPTTRMNPTGRPSKLDTMFRGPMEVISNKGRSYVLKDLVLNKPVAPKDIHQLKPYYYDPKRTNPIDMALKDYKDLWIVEKIQQHRGKWSQKSKMSFLVKWIGFENPTWQPWTDVRDCDQFHAYLRLHHKEHLRPTRFRDSLQENSELNLRIIELHKDEWLGRA